MPIYTYVCLRCDFTEEQIRCTADRDTSVKCPDCERGMLERQVDAPSVIVKNPAVPRKVK